MSRRKVRGFGLIETMLAITLLTGTIFLHLRLQSAAQQQLDVQWQKNLEIHQVRYEKLSSPPSS